MNQVRTAQTIDPSTLTGEQKARLADQLYSVHQQVFKGLDREGFDHYVVSSRAEATRIFVYRNQQEECVGYFGVHRFHKVVEGHALVVFRAEVGLLPEYRQSDANTTLWLVEAAKYKLSHLTQPVYFLYAPVSPSFYAMIARYTHRLYPKHDEAMPEHVERLVLCLAQEFALAQADKHHPLVRQVGWSTQALGREKHFWEQSPNPHVRFYIETNPRFSEGTGLLTIIPVTLPNLLVSLLKCTFHVLRKKLRRFVAPPPSGQRHLPGSRHV